LKLWITTTLSSLFPSDDTLISPLCSAGHTIKHQYKPESASRPLVSFGVLNDNLIKCLISFVEVYEQILSNRYKGIHGYITQSAIMML
jgi:hypothetical protein